MNEATSIGSVIAAISTLIIGFLTYRNRTQETTAQRLAREAEERRAEAADDDKRAERVSDEVWQLVGELRAQLAEVRQQGAAQGERIAVLETTIAMLRDQNLEVRGDLAQAKYTIQVLTAENERLKVRITELEQGQHHEAC